MRYYIIAGEASGDLHGSNLIRELKKTDGNAIIRCWGGDLMEHAGATLVKHYRDLAFMGFAEIVAHLPTILKNINFCKKDILHFNPDVLILIDYPGFNLRMAKWAHKKNFKVAYYISPKVWAWKESRVKKIREYVDKMLVILPFEKEFYHRHKYEVEFVGHPLIKMIGDEKKKPTAPPFSEKPIIAILPGSRKQEVKMKLPVMLQMVKHFPQYQFIIAQAPGLEDNFMQSFTINYPNISLVKDKTYSLLRQAKAALVTSGTATLETALFAVPQVVCYKVNPISYWVARWLIKVKFISLVNLIMNKEVVRELIQDKLTEENLLKELSLLLNDDSYRQNMLTEYAMLWNKLGNRDASAQAAQSIYELIR